MLSRMIKTDLKIIEADSGSIYHALKNTDVGFNKFGEVYFSSITKDTNRAWKLHKKNLIKIILLVKTKL